jgi:hypothetical protein
VKLTKEAAMSKKRLSPSLKVWIMQRAIVLQLLRDDHDPLWTREELEGEISDFNTRVFTTALERLVAEDCVVLDSKGARATTPLRHLDTLELVGV